MSVPVFVLMNKHVTDLKAEFECKSEDDATGTFTGVASTTDADSDNDIIEAGAFEPIPTRTAPNGSIISNVLMLRDHDRSQVIGGWRSFKQTGTQLVVEGELALAVEKARETHELMKRGFLSGLSVCFSVHDPKHMASDKAGRRLIKKAQLRECSIVGFPANQNARIVSVKSEVDSWLIERGFASGDLERLLRQLRKQGNGEDPPDPEGDEDRDTYITRCLRATGGDMEACHAAWDDWEEDAEEDKYDQHLLPRAKWKSKRLKEADPEKPWGDVDYADPGYQDDKVKRYPIDVKWRIRAAWNRVHQRDNRAQYTADQLDRIEARIVAAWKKKIDPDGPPAYQEEQNGKGGKSTITIKAIDGHGVIDQDAVAAKTREIMAQLTKRAQR